MLCVSVVAFCLCVFLYMCLTVFASCVDEVNVFYFKVIVLAKPCIAFQRVCCVCRPANCPAVPLPREMCH